MIVNPGTGSGGLALTGTTDQVVGFDTNGKPTAISKEELRGPQGIQGPAGATGATGPQGPAGPGMPSGAIVMWSGSINTIPSGWVLCNGANGTPDLRNRFIVGAGSSYGVGAMGGSDMVTLTRDTIPPHQHNIDNSSVKGAYAKAGTDQHVFSGFGSATIVFTQMDGGSGLPHENRPPYYALCFIMKQ